MTHPLFHRPFTRAVKVGSDATWAVTRLAVRSGLVVPRLAAWAPSFRWRWRRPTHGCSPTRTNMKWRDC